MPDNKLFIELDSESKLETVLLDGKYDGFGDNGSQVQVAGEIRKITVSKNGFTQFAIWIGDDGSLQLTDYGSLCFQQSVGTNFRLTPSRTWRDH